MTLSQFRPATVLFALIGCMSLAAAPAQALDPQLRDDAGFFSAQTVDQANTIIKQIKDDHRKDFMIETYPSIPVEMQADYSPDRRAQFFENWNLKRAEQLGVDGVFVLICKDPSRVEVRTGKNTRQRAFPASDADQVTQILARNFKNKQFDQGLLEAVRFAQQTFDRNLKSPAASTSLPPMPQTNLPSNAAPPLPPVGSAPPVFKQSSGLFGLGPCFTVAIVLIGLFVIIRIVRRMTMGGQSSGPGPMPGPGYGGYGGGGGGGFGGGFLGGILGSILGGQVQDRWSQHSGGSSSMPPPSSGGAFNEPPQSFPSDSGSSGSGADFGSSSSGSDFGGGGGGDSGSSGSGADF